MGGYASVVQSKAREGGDWGNQASRNEATRTQTNGRKSEWRHSQAWCPVSADLKGEGGGRAAA